jgi:hypothetical protein
MTSKTGGHVEAAARATHAAMGQGCTRLEALYLGHVASWGGECWQTDGTVQGELRRPDGRPYHRESIARVRRFLRDRGLLQSQRIFLGGKIPSPRARWRSSHGTTFNVIQWRELSIKNPMGRAERRRRRIELAIQERGRELEKRRREFADQVQETARFSGVTTAIDPTSTRPLGLEAMPDLQREIDRAREALGRAWERQHAAAGRSGQASGRPAAAARPPPDG